MHKKKRSEGNLDNVPEDISFIDRFGYDMSHSCDPNQLNN